VATPSQLSFSRKLKGEFGWKDTQATDKRYYWVGIKLKDFTAVEEGQGSLV
jgi:hypothetical protein